MQFGLVTFLIFIGSTHCQFESYSYNPAKFTDAARRIKDLIASTRNEIKGGNGDFINGTRTGTEQDIPYVAGFVRLIYHDCTGDGCDGCIDHGNANNRGLVNYTRVLDELYLEFDDVMTRADFYALAGWTALDVAPQRPRAVELAGRFDGDQSEVTRKFKRLDCDESPDEDNESEIFPQSCFTFQETIEYFEKEFGFNQNETIAIMGCHTLGMVRRHKNFKGGEWVKGGGCSSRLNVKYFQKFLATDATPKWITKTESRTNNMCIWRSGGVFLDADISLAYEFSRNNKGKVNCKICTDLNQTNCCIKSPGHDKTMFYRDNNTEWLKDLSVVMTKMLGKKKVGNPDLVDITYDRPAVIEQGTNKVKREISKISAKIDAIEADVNSIQDELSHL